MGLKILHSADWHLDSPFVGFSGEQQKRLKEELGKIPEKIVDICRRESCDLMLLAGDVFDGKPNRDTVDKLKALLKDCGVPVFISPGNHDYCAPGSVWLEESWPENVHVFTGGLESVVIDGLDCRVYGAGYKGMDCPGLLQGFRAEGAERYQLAVLHGDPVQRNSPYCPITGAQVEDSGLDYLALGHIHKAGVFRGGDTLCAWPGTPMGRGYDETGEKLLYVVELEKQAELRRISLDVPAFYDLTVDVEETALDEILPPGGSSDFYRLTLTGSGNEDVTELLSRFPNLELRDQRQEPVDLWAAAEADTLEGTYFRMLREAMDAAEEERQKQILLAAEISRKILEGREVVL